MDTVNEGAIPWSSSALSDVPMVDGRNAGQGIVSDDALKASTTAAKHKSGATNSRRNKISTRKYSERCGPDDGDKRCDMSEIKDETKKNKRRTRTDRIHQKGDDKSNNPETSVIIRAVRSRRAAS